jgi:hypothetical protein
MEPAARFLPGRKNETPPKEGHHSQIPCSHPTNYPVYSSSQFLSLDSFSESQFFKTQLILSKKVDPNLKTVTNYKQVDLQHRCA